MWQMISNISSIVTCFLFILYIIGRIIRVIVTMHSKYEEFDIEKIEDSSFYQDKRNAISFDDVGTDFSVSSIYGIKCISIYSVRCTIDNMAETKLLSKELRKEYKNINVNKKLYVKADLGEIVPTTLFEIERMDFTKVSFYVHCSGRDGSIITSNYKYKMTFKAFIYYLCV